MPVLAEREAWHATQAQAVHGGELDVRLEDGTQADLVTDTHAIEIDHSENWAEAIGQSLHYARMTGKKAGIILIMHEPTAPKHLKRLRAVIAHYRLPIDVFTTEKGD